MVRVAARNATGLDEWRRRLAPARVPLQAARGIRARNTHARSRRDIAAHYDLGNELFALMLDETMMYSSAYFPRRGMTLAQASTGEARAGVSRARPTSRRPRARDRHGMGRVRRPRRANEGLPGHDHHDLARAVRARPRVGAGGRGRRSGHGAVRGLSRPARTLREARLHRDDRGRRVSRLRHVLRALLEPARRRRDDAAAGDRHRRSSLRGREGLAELHPHPHLPGRLPALARR